MNLENTINDQAVMLLSGKQAWHYKALPYKSPNGSIYLYIDNKADKINLKNELELITGRSIHFTDLEDSAIDILLNKYYPNERKDSRQQSEFYSGDADNFLHNLIGEAQLLKSSDIHIETFDELCRVRIRIDGKLLQRYTLEKKQYPALINKIKIIAHLDIAEKRLPQDGRIFYEIDGKKFDIRVSVLPTLHGEKIVLRLLNNDSGNINIHSLGFSEFDLNNYMEGIRKPHGLALISGPTGSGKTTTLYATLKLLNEKTRNILTIEDPIEYTLDGINQVQLKESIGLSFSSALKTFLRQDPDVIMLGEIRDMETANMAIRAALTGHLVLSTIHTNSAWGIISRLIDMGVPSYLLANTLNTAVAQRLVRLLCNSCRKSVPMNNSLYPPRFKPEHKIEKHFIPVGCSECFNTGYKGRKSVYEVISVDAELADLIRETKQDIKAVLKDKKIKTLSENAFSLFENGLTSIDEIYPLLIN
jgi:general secretion pathway protein E/type IV pilus assembly protein PilB